MNTMTKTMTILALFAALAIPGCGGGGSVTVPPPVGGPAPIDPSGNWTMTATDGGGHSIQLAALFAQTGSVVTANSFSAFGNGGSFSCTPFSATLSNGQVLNVNNFTGTVTFGGNFGSFTFDATLAPDGKSFTGTYSNMMPCTGLLSSGTFAGAEVPTISGNWTGTVQPCAYNGTTGICTTSGATSAFTTSLSQDDVTGHVTGSYQLAGVAGFSSGTIAISAPTDILSGTVWAFTLTDNAGSKASVCGGCTPGANGVGLSGLDLQGNFSGLFSVQPAPSNYYWMVISH